MKQLKLFPQELVEAYEDQLPVFLRIMGIEGGAVVTDESQISDFCDFGQPGPPELLFALTALTGDETLTWRTPVWQVLAGLQARSRAPQ